MSAILLQPAALYVSLSAFVSALLLVLGLTAKLKPRALGYAAVVFEEMPLVPFIATLVLGIFVVLLTIVLKATEPPKPADPARTGQVSSTMVTSSVVEPVITPARVPPF